MALWRSEASELCPRGDNDGLTANAIKGDRERCLAADMDEYLSKPIDSSHLLELLRKFLSIPEQTLPQSEDSI